MFTASKLIASQQQNDLGKSVASAALGYHLKMEDSLFEFCYGELEDLEFSYRTRAVTGFMSSLC